MTGLVLGLLALCWAVVLCLSAVLSERGVTGLGFARKTRSLPWPAVPIAGLSAGLVAYVVGGRAFAVSAGLAGLVSAATTRALVARTHHQS